MENRVINHKNFVISTEEGMERGIFFRSPIQKVDFDAYSDEPRFSAWKYLKDIKKPIRRIYEILIGNGKIVKHIGGWSENMDWAGFNGNILCFPIYFKRLYRKLNAISCGDDNIQEIISYGFESEFNTCSGNCDMEKTTIRLKNGKKIHCKRKEQFHFTYSYIVEDIIDTGNIK